MALSQWNLYGIVIQDVQILYFKDLQNAALLLRRQEFSTTSEKIIFSIRWDKI
jgi:hypothetical protein